MSWHWTVVQDHEGAFWKTVEPDMTWARLYLFDGVPCGSATLYGHQIIKVTIEHSPIQARLYKLVYGSLP